LVKQPAVIAIRTKQCRSTQHSDQITLTKQEIWENESVCIHPEKNTSIVMLRINLSLSYKHKSQISEELPKVRNGYFSSDE